MTSTPRRVNGNMNDTDALLWTIGRDPVLRTTIVAILVLDRAPRWGDVRGRVEGLTQLVPGFRSRVESASPLGWGRPKWVEDPRFDLDVHLRRMIAPPPATLRTVLDLAQVMGTTAFDPELPLWEAVVVEGIEGGKAALVIKLHHALVDGVGGIAVALHLLDRRRQPRPVDAAFETAPVAVGSPVDGSPVGSGGPAGVLGARVAQVTSTSRRVLQGALRAASDPVTQANRALATAESVGNLLAPARRPLSKLMMQRSLRRRFEVLDVAAGSLHDAATVTGVTLNDLFITGILGGLHRYHHKHGVEVDQLRVLMPISVRRNSDAVGGNRFVPARFAAPCGADPAERLRRVHDIAGSWKHAPGLGLSGVLAAALDVMPPPLATAVWGSMLKGDDVAATNVPGPPFETYLAGGLVERFYAFAPPSGAALNVSLVTSADRACVGINLDTAAVPDGAILVRCLEEGFDEVLRLGDMPSRSKAI